MQTISRADMGTQIFDGNITSTIDAQQPSEYVFVWIYATSGVWAPSVYLTRVFNCCDRVLPTRRSCETLAGSSVVVHFNECALTTYLQSVEIPILPRPYANATRCVRSCDWYGNGIIASLVHPLRQQNLWPSSWVLIWNSRYFLWFWAV